MFKKFGTSSPVNQRLGGFTIVELLVVIVVIGVLASIGVISYVGIQNRANDSAVQSDLANYAKKAEMYKIINDQYPTATELPQLNTHATTGAYTTDYHNLFYCTERDSDEKFSFVGRSKSGTVFYASSNGTGTIRTGATGNQGLLYSEVCGVADIENSSDRQIVYGYISSSDTWRSWAQR